MVWHTRSLRRLMLEYHKLETSTENPNYNFIEELKELWSILDEADLSKFIVKDKEYDLYPLRNVLEDSDESRNRFNMEEMADAGEAYGELLELIRKDLSIVGKEDALKTIVQLPLEKHFTCHCGKQQSFPFDDDCMMLILMADVLAADYGYTDADDYTKLLRQQGKLPQYVKELLTKDLDFHQKEHLRKWRFQPDDWKYKALKLKSNSYEARMGRVETPDVISINLTWQQSSPQAVLTTLNMIPSTLKLSDMFETDSGTPEKRYYFKGMIWYWGLHYFWYIRHVTDRGEFWIEYNDEEMFRMSSWAEVVEDWVKTWSTPTLLIFENKDTVEYQRNIGSLTLNEDILEDFFIASFKKTRTARVGAVNLTSKSTKDLVMEGAENFRTDSDPHVATYSGGKSYPYGGSSYGVSSHSTKVIEDNWNWAYCGYLNSEDCYTCTYCKKTNQDLKDMHEQKNYFKHNDPKDIYG